MGWGAGLAWAGGCPGRRDRRAAPDRVPAGAGAGADLPGPGLPDAPRRSSTTWPTGSSTDGSRPGRSRELAGHRRGHRTRDRPGRRPARCRSTCAGWRTSRPGRWPPAAPSCGPRLRGDLHTHSDWSDGGSPIREMALAARELGHEYMALTDHSPRLTVANGLSAERLLQQLDIVAALNEELAPFRILTGIEVDILDDGSLDQDPELLARLDVVVASVHSKLRMPSSAHDCAHGRRCRQPACRHPRPLHRAAWSTGNREQAGVGVRRGDRLRGVPAVRCGRRGQLAARSGCDPPTAPAVAGRARPAACSRSTPTRTRPGSWSGRRTGASGPQECGVDPDRVIDTWPMADVLAHGHRS